MTFPGRPPGAASPGELAVRDQIDQLMAAARALTKKPCQRSPEEELHATLMRQARAATDQDQNLNPKDRCMLWLAAIAAHPRPAAAERAREQPEAEQATHKSGEQPQPLTSENRASVSQLRDKFETQQKSGSTATTGKHKAQPRRLSWADRGENDGQACPWQAAAETTPALVTGGARAQRGQTEGIICEGEGAGSSEDSNGAVLAEAA